MCSNHKFYGYIINKLYPSNKKEYKKGYDQQKEDTKHIRDM